MLVTLKSCGNPDYDQNPNRKLLSSRPDLIAEVSTYKEASKVCRQFIKENNLGGGNWSGGKIYSGKKLLANVSFNGRVWAVDGSEIKNLDGPIDK